ncbi:MAG: hypothetical protein CL607_14415 [Anaerolineaceae bacterium]|nr:hypothetical protein [Anaerolineaceae bacterium]
MDINQLAQMIEWLDEERRRDKTTIATLEERLAQQTDTIDTLQRRLNNIESDQTVMREQTGSPGRESDLLESLRGEMRQLLEGSESRRLTAEREAERRNELNREGIMRTIRDLTERFDKIQRDAGSLGELKTESSRVVDQMLILQQRLDDLDKKQEEPDRRLAFLEEQRRQDARRISEAETELPEVKKQIDNIRPKLDLLEDLALRNERRVQEIQNTERDRRDQIQQFIDSQSLVMSQRDQQVEDLMKKFSAHDTAMQENIERFESWAQAYRDMKRIIDDFERIGDRLERRINEVAEMQRLSEERFRQEWNDWRDDDQKRWKQLTLSSDEVWRNHDKEFEQFVTRIEELEGDIPPLEDSLKRIWGLERERAQLYRERYQALLLEYDKTGVESSLTATSTTEAAAINGVQTSNNNS